MDLVQAENMCCELMEVHGLYGWSFRWDRCVRRFGACYCTQRRIQLSSLLVELNSAEKVRETILHEIAHAIAGHEAGHGGEWRRVARFLGISATRCYNSNEVATPKLRYKLTCKFCPNVIYKARKCNRRSCGKCSPRVFKEEFLLEWSLNK